MKHIRNLTLTFIGATMLFISCAKTNTNPTNSNNNPSSTNSFSVSLNGLLWTAKADSGQLLGADVANVYGIKGSSVIYLSLNSLSPGTYTLTSGGQTSVNYSPDGIGLFKSDSGSVVITSYSDSIVKGNFQGRLTNGTNTGYIYKMTNGKFTTRLKY